MWIPARSVGQYEIGCLYREIAGGLYAEGYRKQSEGEWVLVGNVCPYCGHYGYIEESPERDTQNKKPTAGAEGR